MTTTLPKCEPFVVKHYTGDDLPSIKGNGFDGLSFAETREDVEEFIAWVNARLASPPLPETVVAVLRAVDASTDYNDDTVWDARDRWRAEGRPGLLTKDSE